MKNSFAEVGSYLTVLKEAPVFVKRQIKVDYIPELKIEPQYKK